MHLLLVIAICWRMTFLGYYKKQSIGDCAFAENILMEKQCTAMVNPIIAAYDQWASFSTVYEIWKSDDNSVVMATFMESEGPYVMSMSCLMNEDEGCDVHYPNSAMLCFNHTVDYFELLALNCLGVITGAKNPIIFYAKPAKSLTFTMERYFF